MLLLILMAGSCLCQVQTIHVRPDQTDPGYDAAEDSSAVSWNMGSQLDKVFLFLGGTGSSSSLDYNALRLHAAGLGFDFINLSYPNDVAAASLANSTDSLVFNKYRQEACFGTPVSDDVTIDSLNSIHTRAVRLVHYLELTYPAHGWGQYLATPDSLDWSRIIVGGHSQGSGHACYLAKQFAVERVLMFAGPNDYSNFFPNSANWIRQAGATPVSSHYSYLSLYDEVVDYFKQFDVIDGLGMLAADDSTHVDGLSPPYGNSHCLYTTQPPGIVLLDHNVPIMLSSINNSVWTYMLTSSMVTAIDAPDGVPELSVFPNPTTSALSIRTSGVLADKAYTLRSITGEVVAQGRVPAAEIFTLDLSGIAPGVYFLSLDSRHVQVVIQ